MSRIEAKRLLKRFGGVVALDDVSLAVEPGEFVGLIGPNGSGKTTLLNLLSGFYRPDSGEVWYDEARVDGVESQILAMRGLTRSFQVTKIFRRISVLENLLVPGLVDWSCSRSQAEGGATAILADLQLGHLSREMASSLSGGQAKLLEFGRLMMLTPKVVLLDEPFGGVHPTLKARMHDVIRRWHERGVTILLISHDMGSVFGLCPRVVVLHNGRVIADDAAAAVRRMPSVIEAYLGDQAVRAV
jgi:ABC-type branched-subunit amino acid transport system ATPase component